MKFVKILIVCLCFSFLQAKLITFIEKMEICYLPKNGPIWVGNITIDKRKNENSYIKGLGEFYRDLDSSKLKAVVNLTKCASRESLDYCEPFPPLKPSNICMFLSLKHVTWEPFVNGFVPPFKCPFKKGKMVGYNVTFDINLFNLFPVQNTFWKIDLSLFENDIKLMEFCTDMRFLPRK